jgi:hypothetical protein
VVDRRRLADMKLELDASIKARAAQPHNSPQLQNL